MLYETYELQRSMLARASAWAELGSSWFADPGNPMAGTAMGSMLASGLSVFAHASATYGKPAFRLPATVTPDGEERLVTEAIEAERPFGRLIHFTRDPAPAGQPRLLVVAPMSGHHATLLRGTVERLLPGHDVWITDWTDARTVPPDAGRFDLDDYLDYVIGFLRHIGPGTHLLAVCQPSVPCFAAAALMSEDGDPARPASLTLMGGPIDTREAPTAVDDTATDRPLSWFEQNLIATVPARYAGAGRRVYPGFLQLTGFMAMNLPGHIRSHWEMFQHMVAGDEEGAAATRAFYDEYRSVCDMTAEFYLQTIDVVFQRHLLPQGLLTHRGRPIRGGAIRDVPLLAVEGERDDISGIGQTRAALTIATDLPDALKRYHLAEGVGHYGIFNGRRWRDAIAPEVIRFIAEAEARR